MKTVTDKAINEIAKNNKLAEKLTKLQEVTESLYGRYGIDNNHYERLIYKDNEGNEIDHDEFFLNILNWIDINLTYLQRESISMFK